MKTYIDIINFDTGEVVERINVTGKGERYIDRVERGIAINLDHDEYYLALTEEK